MRDIVLVVHNVRSAHNVGSLLRTADGLGVSRVILSGYTPYPAGGKDERLPHIAAKVDRQIAKTSLGAEKTVHWERADELSGLAESLEADGYTVAALEQTEDSLNLNEFEPPEKVALIVGNEVKGLDERTLGLASVKVEIPMFGQKESFNVAVAAAMALYHLRFS
ncbi:MAG TPA: TrmH family RNA methyltransferase [Candidatus Saccharimonadales bacterium]|nr:TrmH family RNA methyltransferase [Candidatus Saccharimonadales bacterium]